MTDLDQFRAELAGSLAGLSPSQRLKAGREMADRLGVYGSTTTNRSGSSTTTSASATSSGTTDGCSATPTSNAYLVKFSWTDIVRHVMVTGAASPDDPALTDYWARRRRKYKPPLDNYTLRLLARQDARCPLCGDHLLTADQPPQSPHDWERWWLQVTRKAIAVDYLVHHGETRPTGQ